MTKEHAEKLELVKGKVIIIGVDIAKKKNLARFINEDGIELCKKVKFKNDQGGMFKLIRKVEAIQRDYNPERFIIGMEPTGHYWEPLAYFLKGYPIHQVFVNPYHVQRIKEMEDNSPGKDDKKDAILIARLIKEGRFFKMYLPEGIYRDLRNLSYQRQQERKILNNAKNRLTAQLDRYFPEFKVVLKNLAGKTAKHLMKNYPLPSDINQLSEDELTTEIKKASNNRLGFNKARLLKTKAKESIGLKDGQESARYRMKKCLDELEFCQQQITQTEKELEQLLFKTNCAESLLSIPGVGTVTAARFLGEIGDITRFTSPKQIIKLAGYNLKTSSSGERRGETMITKRGRSELRNLLYQSALVVVSKNQQFKALYVHLISRPKNPLKKKQALIAIACKLARIMFGVARKNERYSTERMMKDIAAREIELTA